MKETSNVAEWALGADPEHTRSISCLIWYGNASGLPQRELEDVVEETDVNTAVLSLLQMKHSEGRKWADI